MTMLDAPVWQCLLGENEWCTATDPCFTCADALHSAQCAAGECADDCRECKTASLVVGAKVGMDSRGRKFGPVGWKGGNEWERGIVRDHRGVPLMGADLHLIGLKEHGERKHVIEAARRTNAQLAAAAAPTTGSN